MDTHHQKFQSLPACITRAEDLGFKERFMMGPRGLIFENSKYMYDPGETEIKAVFTFDSVDASQPPSLFYLIETSDGKKGYLIQTERMYSDARIPNFIKASASIKKMPSVPDGENTWLQVIKSILKF